MKIVIRGDEQRAPRSPTRGPMSRFALRGGMSLLVLLLNFDLLILCHDRG